MLLTLSDTFHRYSIYKPADTMIIVFATASASTAHIDVDEARNLLLIKYVHKKLKIIMTETMANVLR